MNPPANPPDWYAKGRPHLWLPYAQMKTVADPLPVVASHGCRLVLADGRELVDGVGSWWTACHGHNHPHLRAAVAAQLEVLPHVMLGGLVHEPALRLAGRLAKILPVGLAHVFFSDSGSVAVEVALKMALGYWRNQGYPERRKFLGFRHGYHGDTLATLAVGDAESGFQRDGGLGPGAIIVDLPRAIADKAEFDHLLSAHRHELAAVIVEPLVQGAGGMRMHDPDTLAAVARAAERHGVLLIADEVMTGFGRTGSMFACEQAEVVPDIICLSKALTGGMMGLAATVANDRIYDAFLGDEFELALMHGPTYMGNPLACAAANASLDLFESEPRLEQVAAIERALVDGLAGCRAIPGVAEVRVKGAVGAVQLTAMRHLDWLRRRFPELGVFVRPFGDVVYLTPPFVIAPDELAQLTGAVERALREWATL